MANGGLQLLKHMIDAIQEQDLEKVGRITRAGGEALYDLSPAEEMQQIPQWWYENVMKRSPVGQLAASAGQASVPGSDLSSLLKGLTGQDLSFKPPKPQGVQGTPAPTPTPTSTPAEAPSAPSKKTGTGRITTSSGQVIDLADLAKDGGTGTLTLPGGEVVNLADLPPGRRVVRRNNLVWRGSLI